MAMSVNITVSPWCRMRRRVAGGGCSQVLAGGGALAGCRWCRGAGGRTGAGAGGPHPLLPADQGGPVWKNIIG